MSKAYKCDRCGKLFEPYKKNSNFLHITRNPYMSGECLDLCPKCNAELQSWVANDTVQVDCNCTDEEVAKSFDKKIKVGDEITDSSGDRGVVIALLEYDEDFRILWLDGTVSITNMMSKKKTGRHFNIQNIFDQMKDEQ